MAIGVDPATLLASQAILPLDSDELEVAGALHGAPLPVVRCATNPVRAPAEAEIVIEGRLLPHERAREGPFGEFPQYYGPAGDRPVLAVDAITRRRDAIFHTIVPAAMEHLLLGAIPREASLLSLLRRSFPSVLDVHLPVGGVCRYHLYVQIRKRWDGEPRNVMMGAFAGHADVKQVVVVDEDVDVHDPQAVEWAVATRFQAGEDLVVVPGAQGSRLDPSARGREGGQDGARRHPAPRRGPLPVHRGARPGRGRPRRGTLARGRLTVGGASEGCFVPARGVRPVRRTSPAGEGRPRPGGPAPGSSSRGHPSSHPALPHDRSAPAPREEPGAAGPAALVAPPGKRGGRAGSRFGRAAGG